MGLEPQPAVTSQLLCQLSYAGIASATLYINIFNRQVNTRVGYFTMYVFL